MGLMGLLMGAYRGYEVDLVSQPITQVVYNLRFPLIGPLLPVHELPSFELPARGSP